MTTRSRLVAFVSALIFCTPFASAQSLTQRINDMKDRQSRQQHVADADEAAQLRRMNERVNGTIRQVQFENTSAKAALAWWSKVTEVPLVINWDAMQNQGIDAEAPLNLSLQNVPANAVLGIMLQQMAPPEQKIIAEMTPWYMRIMPREEAVKYAVTRVYDIADMILEVPNFTNAPQMDLTSVLSGGGSGGSGGTGSTSTPSIFNSTTNGSDAETTGATRADRAEQLAQLIRDSIEPDVWIENGGLYSSIQYFQGRLIVRAPMFVQRQIGLSVGSAAGVRTMAARRAGLTGVGGKPSDVSGVAAGPAQAVSTPQGNGRN